MFVKIIFVFFAMPFALAQTNFEILIPWENDTSVSGLYAEEMPDGSFLLLSSPPPAKLLEH